MKKSNFKLDQKDLDTIKIKNLKRIGLIAVISLGVYGSAQMVVSDPTNLAVQMENQAKLIEQIQVAQEQADKMRSMKDNIEKNMKYVEEVNNQIQNVGKIKQIAKNQAVIFNRAYQIKAMFRGSKNLEVVLQAEQTTNAILKGTETNIEELTKVLNSGFFNMSDGDRLEQVNNYEKSTANTLENMNELELFLQQYNSARSIYTMK